MYTTINFKTKKALKEAVKAGKQVRVIEPGISAGEKLRDGATVYLEGPHYPAAHTWYAKATLTNGIITKVT